MATLVVEGRPTWLNESKTELSEWSESKSSSVARAANTLGLQLRVGLRFLPQFSLERHSENSRNANE